jgi:quercetin dioxygenase-like cupin family protein
MKNAFKSTNATESRRLLGTSVKLRLSAKDGNQGLSIFEHFMPFGSATPLHVHNNEDEVFHIIKGSMRLEVGGNGIKGEAGDIILAPRGVPHRFIVDSTEGVHCITITQGQDFENMVTSAAPVAKFTVPFGGAAPTAKEIEAVTAACANNNIDIIGPAIAA